MTKHSCIILIFACPLPWFKYEPVDLSKKKKKRIGGRFCQWIDVRVDDVSPC